MQDVLQLKYMPAKSPKIIFADDKWRIIGHSDAISWDEGMLGASIVDIIADRADAAFAASAPKILA
jgi:hypothetical protein